MTDNEEQTAHRPPYKHPTPTPVDLDDPMYQLQTEADLDAIVAHYADDQTGLNRVLLRYIQNLWHEHDKLRRRVEG